MNALGDIEGGEGLGGMIDAKIAALDVEDAAVEGQYVSSVAEVDGKVVVSRAALPVYEEVGVAAGAAAQALADAKAYVDGIVNDTTADDGAVTKGLNSRIADLEAIDHDKLAADASVAAVATVLDGAPEKFDTLKEVAQWISDSETAASAADLVTRVATLEAIDHDAYVAADTALETSLKDYVDGKVDGKFDAVGAAETAEQNAKSYADGLKTAIDGVIEENERVTAASLTDLDSRIVTLESVDHDAYVGADETVLSNAKTYADNLFTWAEY